MESEKVKEIKNALFCLGNNKICAHCNYDDTNTNCVNLIAKDTLTLINELESENAELKKYKFDWLNSEKIHLQADMEDTEFELYCANKAFKKVCEENRQFEERIAELEKENARLDKVAKHFQELIEDGKLISSEELKEFVE